MGLCVSRIFSQLKAYKGNKETRVVQISTVKSVRTDIKPVRAGNGRLKTTEPTARGRAIDTGDASQVPSPSVGQSRREKLSGAVRRPKGGLVMVPVLSSLNKPLMPCHPARAKELIKKGRAIERWFNDIFCIKLLDRSEGDLQQVVCGVDPGSKREAFTVQSKNHTYLNVLSDAVTWVKDRIEVRKNMRKARRFRKVPCRKDRSNRLVNTKFLSPSTKSCWQAKLRIINFLRKIYPITDYVVEGIKATSKKGHKRWNKSFSPLEVGKIWFYEEVSKIGNFKTRIRNF